MLTPRIEDIKSVEDIERFFFEASLTNPIIANCMTCGDINLKDIGYIASLKLAIVALHIAQTGLEQVIMSHANESVRPVKIRKGL